MSFIVTPEELDTYRTVLTDYAEANSVLDTLEDCEGDLEDAAITIAIQVGQEPDTNDQWLDGLAKRWRPVICRADLKEGFAHGLDAGLVLALTEHAMLPLKLAILVAIYVVKIDMEDFCQPLDEKIW